MWFLFALLTLLCKSLFYFSLPKYQLIFAVIPFLALFGFHDLSLFDQSLGCGALIGCVDICIFKKLYHFWNFFFRNFLVGMFPFFLVGLGFLFGIKPFQILDLNFENSRLALNLTIYMIVAFLTIFSTNQSLHGRSFLSLQRLFQSNSRVQACVLHPPFSI